MKLITETSYDFALTEGKDKSIYIAGIFSTAEMENNNKRKYGRKILEREVTKVQDKIGKNCLWGELGHPPNPEVNPDKIALKIETLEWKGNNVYGKAKLLDTPMGQIAKTLVKEGSMGISSRGLGTVAEDGYVNEDFNLITYDLVTDPSNKPSWVNGIYEGREFSIPGVKDTDMNEDKIKEAQAAYFKYLMETIDEISEATFTVSYGAKSGPGKTKNFPTLKAAREEAKKASMKTDGYVVVMKNGIDEYEYLKGKEKKAY
jgi:hypothetical protein